MNNERVSPEALQAIHAALADGIKQLRLDESPSDIPVAVSVISSQLGVTDRQVQLYAADGIIPKESRGQYPFIESIHRLVHHLREMAATKGAASLEDLRREEQSKKNLLLDIEIAERQQQLIDASSVIVEWEKLLSTFKVKVRLIPRSISQQVADMSASSVADFLKANLAPDQAVALAQSFIESQAPALTHRVESIISAQTDAALDELSRYSPGKEAP